MTKLTADRALALGWAAQNAGKHHEAEKYYRAILKSLQANPISNLHRNILATTYAYMGLVRRDRGDITGYVECFRIAANMKPGDADMLNNLGAAMQYNGELESAIDIYRQALQADPRCAEAHNNLGSALHTIGDIDAAIASFRQALLIKPDYANVFNNMGHAYHDKGDQDASIACYRNALALQPDSAQAHNNLGNALRETGAFADAIKHFDFITVAPINPTNPEFWFNSQSQAIECLYMLGRYDEVEARLNALVRSGDVNLRVAAVSAFITDQLKIADPYTFCGKPLDFFHTGKLQDHVADVNAFTEALIAEATRVHQVWEPQHGVTKFGFQTSPTIFSAGQHCEALATILRKEIAAYHARFGTEDCVYMRAWPAEYDLRGWFVRLLKHGYQKPHNHPSGWLSGVIYLKTLDTDSDEGAIELGLHGHDLPILDDNYARIVHRPQQGDIILFPSSLFHRTIPFNADAERCVIAFDIYRYSR